MTAQLAIGQLQGITPTNEVSIPSDTKLIIEGTLRANNIQTIDGITVYSYAGGTATFSGNITTSSNISGSVISSPRLVIPIWTTSTRPSSTQVGSIGFNSSTLKVEYWDGSGWKNLVITQQI